MTASNNVPEGPYVTVLNTSSLPVAVTPAGRQVPAGGWACVNRNETEVRREIARGTLVEYEDTGGALPGRTLDKAARAAIEATRAANKGNGGIAVVPPIAGDTAGSEE